MRRFALVSCIIGFASLAHAESLPRYQLDVTVDAPARRVHGHARIELENDGDAPLSTLWLWRYPERFAKRSPHLNDYNFWWIYPRTFNPGRMRTGAVVVNGRAATVEAIDHEQAGAGTLLGVTPAEPIAPGARAVIELDFSTEVPTRYGPFGCFRGTCTLSGGFYPMLAAMDAHGQPLLKAPPGRGDYRVTVRVPRVSDVVVNGELHPLERGGALTVALGPALAAALIVGPPRLRRYQTEEKGVHIVLLSGAPEPVPSPPEHLLPYIPSNRQGRVLDTVKEAIDLLDELGLPLPHGETLRLVEGALRIELAQPQPGFVLLSDQVFAIFPLDRFLKFHEFEVARAVYELVLQERIAARERPEDLGWAPGVSASYLVDLFTLRRYRKAEFARQILKWASFIPAIDRILYAPQVPFASAYFFTLEGADPLRDTLAQFDNTLPRGKLIFAKLRDLLGDQMAEVLRLQMAGEPIRAAAERVYKKPLGWFWKQWLGPYPKVDYRFADIRSEREGAGFVHTVVVEKRGEAPPIEPVTVRLRPARGRAIDQTWDGRGQSHTYVFHTSAPLSSVEIDPQGRLAEDLPGSNDDLRFDDRRPPRWKFIYNNFGGLVRVFPSFGLDLSLDFSLDRILDLKNAMRFLVYHTDATQIGVSGSYTRSFGRKVTPGWLTSHLTASLSAARIDPSFAKAVGAGDNPGTALGAGLSLGYDDRLYPWEPVRALSLGLGASTVVTVLDSGAVLTQGTASAGWEQIVRVADGQGFAFALSGAITFGDLRIARQMLAVGGPSGLRGYDVDALLGRADVFGRVEYRHVFVHSLDWNLLHTLYVRGIGGGLFAEAALVSGCSSYAVSPSSVAADVGYSLRIFGDWFGVSQTTLNLDFAIPLIRNDRDCFGQQVIASQRTPFGFFFAFGPPW